MARQAGDPEKVDAVVVGAGASGSLLAAELAEAGKAVVVLEGGPDWRLEDLVSSQLWARRVKWGGPPVETGGPNPLGHNFNTGWGVGGAALHHYAVWLRLHEEDFQVKSRFGVGRDWPITYDELRPYYDRIQAEIGISGDADAEVWRPPGEPYPMRPIRPFAQGEVIRRGFEALGLRVSPLPLAILTEVYRGRRPCMWDGWCDAGCPIGALANPQTVTLPRARAAGAEIRPRSVAVRVLTDRAGTRATGVEYIDAAGERRVQEADVVALAAFAVQTPRLLLLSANAAHPDGLANSSGLVGTGLMTHVARAVWGLFPEETENYLGVTGGTTLSQEGYAKDPGRGYVGGWSWLGGGALKPNDLIGIAGTRPDLWGEPLHAFVRDASRHLAQMTMLGEELPDPGNRVDLGTAKDALGLPVARMTHAFGKDALALWDDGGAQGKAVFEAAGAREVWLGGTGAIHLMGGTPMGTDPADSVADGYGRTHDVPNLVVLGSGLFPTGGAVNPTFTIHALTLRTAEHLVERWAEFG